MLDPFFGSCSCGVACYNTQRLFIGIEKDDNFYTKGVERLQGLKL